MKAAAILNTDSNRNRAVAYPNGITRQEIFRKIVDLLLIAAIGIGAAAILLFLLALA